MKQDHHIADLEQRLLTAYFSGTASPAQEQELWAWICRSPENARTLAELRAIWQRGRISCSPVHTPARFARSLNSLNRRIDALGVIAPARRGRLLTLRRFAAAAAVAVVLAAAFVTYRIATAPFIHTFHNADSVAMHVAMPDGTNVWLGPGTTLRYDDRFHVEGRNVVLDGEAYFDVAHHALKPFVVATPAFHVRVLGTVFNVRAYKAEAIAETTLAEGSVALQHVDGHNLVCLQPGQQAVYDARSGMLEVNEVPVGNLLLLRYGVVTLHDATLDEIVACIEQTYGLGVRFDMPRMPGHRYNFSFQKDAPVEDVIDLLEFVSGHHFEIIQLNP